MAIKIEKQEDGTYTVRVWAKHRNVFGKRPTRQESKIRTYSAAERMGKYIEAHMEEEDYSNLTFSELDEMYMNSTRGLSMSETTLEWLNTYIRPRAANFLGRVKIVDINTRVVQSFADMLARTPNRNNPQKRLSNKTIKEHVSHVNTVINWAVGQDILEYNRIKKIEYPKEFDKFTPTIIDPATAGEVLAWLKKRYYIMYIPILLLSTSPRRGEVLAIQWDTVDFENGIIHLNKNMIQLKSGVYIQDRMKTASSKRPYYMSDFVKSELLEHQEMCKGLDSPYVCANIFTGEVPTPSHVTKTFHKLMLNHFGIDMRLHDLRQSFSQDLYENDVDAVTRSKILGHASEVTTNTYYTQKSESKIRRAINNAGETLRAAFENSKDKM